MPSIKSREIISIWQSILRTLNKNSLTGKRELFVLENSEGSYDYSVLNVKFCNNKSPRFVG